MKRTAAETHSGCTQSLREDRAAGLIYGPYAICTYGTVTAANDPHGLFSSQVRRDNDGDEITLVNSFVFAAATGKCTYCGGALPKGRRLYLLRFVPKCLKVAVVLSWRAVWTA